MRRSAISRLILITTIASLAAGLIGATGAAARGPEPSPEIRKAARPDWKPAPTREPRSVTVRELPSPSNHERNVPATRPDPLTALPGPAAPDIAAAPSPVFSSASGALNADEAVAWAGLASDLSFEPPDPWVAVGPEHVFQAVNTTFEIRDRSGAVLDNVDMFDFFGLGAYYDDDPSRVRYFDPRVVYDSLHGRWIAIEASFDCDDDGSPSIGHGWIDYAVSTTADPMGEWLIDSIGYNDVMLDYPGIGTSTDKVVISANVFDLVDTGVGMGCAPGIDFLGTELDAIAWSWLIDGTFFLPDSFVTEGPAFFTWRPALQTPATSPTVHLIVETGVGGVSYATLTGNPATGSSVLSTPIDLTTGSVVAPFATPLPPRQPGSPGTIAAAVDSRPTDAIWQGNQLAFVSTLPCDPPGSDVEVRDCVRVTELSTAAATPTALQDFLIGEEDADLYMGGIGYAGNGDLHVVWTRSSEDAGQYPSSYAAHQLATDAANELSEPQLLKAGTGTYPGTRWGDYVGVAQDPQVPNAVWQANQYSAGAGWWGTHVSQLQTGGSSYVPIAPLRIVDTRPGAGNVQLSGTFNTNVPRSFDVAGRGTIPNNAIAVTGNVTVTGQTSAGFVAITANPTATPPSSTINFPLGDTRANNFTIPLNQIGGLAAVYRTSAAAKQTHLIVDITGYFLAGDASATYATLTPTRVMDTRGAPFHIGPLGQFAHNVPQTLSVAGALGVPADATAITGNLTVVGQNSAGYFSVTPAPPVGTPTTSSLNFPLGDNRANGLTADLNASGDLTITLVTTRGATGRAHALLDVTGYYRDTDTGLLFYPLNPGRVLDSRPGAVLTGLAGTFGTKVPRTLEVGSHWGAPAGAQAVTGNLTVVSQTSAGFASITKTPIANPSTSTINFPLGDTRANGVTVPLEANNLSLVYVTTATGKTTHLLLDLTGYFK